MLPRPEIEAILALIYDFKHAPPDEKAFLWREINTVLSAVVRNKPNLSVDDAYAHLLRNHYPDYARRRTQRERPEV